MFIFIHEKSNTDVISDWHGLSKISLKNEIHFCHSVSYLSLYNTTHLYLIANAVSFLGHCFASLWLHLIKKSIIFLQFIDDDSDEFSLKSANNLILLE